MIWLEVKRELLMSYVKICILIFNLLIKFYPFKVLILSSGYFFANWNINKDYFDVGEGRRKKSFLNVHLSKCLNFVFIFTLWFESGKISAHSLECWGKIVGLYESWIIYLEINSKNIIRRFIIQMFLKFILFSHKWT